MLKIKGLVEFNPKNGAGNEVRTHDLNLGKAGNLLGRVERYRTDKEE